MDEMAFLKVSWVCLKFKIGLFCFNRNARAQKWIYKTQSFNVFYQKFRNQMLDQETYKL